MTEIGEVSWNNNLEAYFKSTGEKAHGLSWIHKRSEEVYSKRRTWIDLPVIILSGAIGFLNGASNSIFGEGSAISPVALGVGSMFCATLQTVNTYFGWAKRAEGHRISSIQYSRLYRFLTIEMSLPREERARPHELLKYTRDCIDRLQEISPLIPPIVIQEYRRRFDRLTNVAHPEDANGLERIEIYQELPPQLSIRIPQTASALDLETALQTPAVSAPKVRPRQTVSRTDTTQPARSAANTGVGGSVPPPPSPSNAAPTHTGAGQGAYEESFP